MFHPLPQETIFEAQKRSRRSIRIIFVLLLGLMSIAFSFMAVAFAIPVFFFVGGRVAYETFGLPILEIAAAGMVGGIIFSIIHFNIARNKTLDASRMLVGAKPIDFNDTYHKRFANTVQEAVVALGGKITILPMIIPTTGANICSVQARNGSAICATEGLLAKLTRGELAAVVAREAARIAENDARLTTITCGLVNVFDKIADTMAESGEAAMGVGRPLRGVGGRAAIAAGTTWIVARMAHGVLSFLFMALSRDRGFLADACGVHMSKDPIGLAEALLTIGEGYRGGGDVRPGYEALYLVDPSPSPFSESGGFFSIFATHPNTPERIKKLLVWAHADVSALKGPDKKATLRRAENQKSETDKKEEFFVRENEKWRGPYLATQMLAMGILKPDTWIALVAGDEIMRASNHPGLMDMLAPRNLKNFSTSKCPRCKMSLLKKTYEGAPVETCTFCNGMLIKKDVLARVISRRDESFTEQEIAKASKWKKYKSGSAYEACGYPVIACPKCDSKMHKRHHSSLVRVVIDACTSKTCGAIWLDKGEIEGIQIITETS